MTLPEWRGQGYARQLIERSLMELARHGYSELFLAVTEGNTPAEQLYRKLGFVVMGPA